MAIETQDCTTDSQIKFTDGTKLHNKQPYGFILMDSTIHDIRVLWIDAIIYEHNRILTIETVMRKTGLFAASL